MVENFLELTKDVTPQIQEENDSWLGKKIKINTYLDCKTPRKKKFVEIVRKKEQNNYTGTAIQTGCTQPNNRECWEKITVKLEF